MSAVNKSPMVKTAVPINKLYTIHDTLIIGSALYMPLEFLPSFEVIKFVYCQERKKDPIKSAPKTYIGELAIKSHWNNCKNKAKINDNKKKSSLLYLWVCFCLQSELSFSVFQGSLHCYGRYKVSNRNYCLMSNCSDHVSDMVYFSLTAIHRQGKAHLKTASADSHGAATEKAWSPFNFEQHQPV